jgi:HEAT repeat protein
MILLLASWAFLQTPPGEDEAILRRMAELVELLGSDEIDVRERAGEELLGLPARFAAKLDEFALKVREPEIAARLKALALPLPWIKILGGTLREARLRVAALEGLENVQRRQAVAAAIEGLAARPPSEASTALAGLLDLPAAGARDFALEGMARFPPKELESIVRMLEDPASAVRAATILLRARDPSVVPRVTEIFLQGSSPQAGKVLEHLGAAGDPERILALARKEPALRPTALRIVMRSDPDRAEDALLALLKEEKKDGALQDLLETLALIGGEKSIAAVRAHFTDREDRSRDETLAALRDPSLGMEGLRAARKNPAEVEPERLLQMAAFSGPAAREEILAWIAEPGLKLGVQKKILPLLGAVGRREDAGLLVAKLKDPRLLESVAEALDMLGDPGAAPDLAQALMRSPHYDEAGRILLSLPVESVTAAVEEILFDPRGYDPLYPAALRLAAKSSTPRMRAALFEELEKQALSWNSHRADAIRILAATAGTSDDHRIRNLCAHENAEVRAAGLMLAFQRGNREAAAELARLLADPKMPPYNLDVRLPLEIVPMKVWKPLLLEEWQKRTDWTWGALLLAEAGVPEAMAELRRRRDALAQQGFQERVGRALALGGDPADLDLFVEQLNRGMRPGYEDALVVGAGEGLKKRLLAKALSLGLGRPPYLSLVARMAIPEAAPLFLGALESGARSQGDEVRLSIIALGALKRRDAIPDIRPHLRSTDPGTMAAAAAALGELGDRPSLGWIVRLVDDPTEVPDDREHSRRQDVEPKRRIWHAAMEALEKLTGVATVGGSVADRREFWRTWYAKNK